MTDTDDEKRRKSFVLNIKSQIKTMRIVLIVAIILLLSWNITLEWRLRDITHPKGYVTQKTFSDSLNSLKKLSPSNLRPAAPSSARLDSLIAAQKAENQRFRRGLTILAGVYDTLWTDIYRPRPNGGGSAKIPRYPLGKIFPILPSSNSPVSPDTLPPGP